MLGCSRTPELDRAKAADLLTVSRAMNTPMNLWEDFGIRDIGSTPEPVRPMRQLLGIDGVALDDGGKTAQVDFRWKWSQAFLKDTAFRTHAAFRLYDDGWRVDEDGLLVALRRSRPVEEAP